MLVKGATVNHLACPTYYSDRKWLVIFTIDQSYKSHNALAPYPTMHHLEQKCANPTMDLSHAVHHSEQKCVHFCLNGALCGIWDRCIVGFVRLVSIYVLYSPPRIPFATACSQVRCEQRGKTTNYLSIECLCGSVVGDISAILFGPQWVNSTWWD